MSDPSSKREPLWTSDLPVGHGPQLQQDIVADVCIVGAGMSGLTLAYLLAKEGKDVVILDAYEPCSGDTQCTTAHLACAIDDRFFQLESWHGRERSKLAAESHAAAIDTIEELVCTLGVDCDFERLPGYLFQPDVGRTDILDRELPAAHNAGLSGVEKVEHMPDSLFGARPALRFPNQAQFHPIKYLKGIADAFVALGGRIFTNSRVVAVNNNSRAQVAVENGHTVDCASAVVATNPPINDRFMIHTKQAPYRTYALACEIPAGSVPRALYWDTLDAYHYVRVQAHPDDESKEILIVGGEDHKTGQDKEPNKRWEALESWAREHFPMITSIRNRWSGQVMETTDGLAFIGRNPGEENVYIATGDSGMGLTHGTIAGLLLRDLILKRKNAWTEVYDPSRKNLGAAREFLRENLNVASQYLDWLPGDPVHPERRLAKGEGCIRQAGASKVAVYRDEEGKLHEMLAACPHLGAVVQWNAAEKCWDCPCHGSHFSATGEVLCGPSTKNLEPLSEVDPDHSDHEVQETEKAAK